MTLGALGPATPTGRLDPLETAAYLAAVTSRLGLVVETPVVGAEPFHLANRLASLDWAAQGRAGWAVAAPRRPTPRRSEDVVEAVRTLWDTWEDGVFLADEATGRFLDVERWHYADFQGEHFSVKGPAITPRPPQGHLPVIGGEGADVVARRWHRRRGRAGPRRRRPSRRCDPACCSTSRSSSTRTGRPPNASRPSTT